MSPSVSPSRRSETRNGAPPCSPTSYTARMFEWLRAPASSCFVRETADAPGIAREEREEHLDGDLATQTFVARAPDLAATTGTEQPKDGIGANALARVECPPIAGDMLGQPVERRDRHELPGLVRGRQQRQELVAQRAVGPACVGRRTRDASQQVFAAPRQTAGRAAVLRSSFGWASRERAIEPGPRERPIVVDGPHGDVRAPARFRPPTTRRRNGAPRRSALRGCSTASRSSASIDRDEVGASSAAAGTSILVQGHANRSRAAAPLGPAPSRDVDEDAAHHLRGDAEEVAADSASAPGPSRAAEDTLR